MARFSGSGGGDGTPGPQGPPGADANTGDITFDGIQIIGAGTAAGDGSNNGTIELVPDGDLNSDQYIIIDPTGPNHIHIRAGGTQDASNSELILGGERNKVAVSDLSKSVAITTAATITNTYVNAHEANSEDLIVPDTSDILIGDNIVIAGISHPVTYFSPDPNNTGFSIVRATGVTFTAGESYTFVREEPYENSWQFNSDGVFYGPGMGVVKVPAIANTGPDNDLYLYAYGANADLRLVADQDIRLATEYGNVVLNADGGEFIGSSGSPENQIATIGDLNNTVSSITDYSPVWSATGLEFTGTPATGAYVKIGNLVQVQLDVNFTNVTNFGSGQYSLTLPLPSKYHTDVYGGSIHNVGSITDHYSLKGHLSPTSSTMTLWYISGSSQDQIFDFNSPINLVTADKFHMSFSYIADTEAP